ncbi:MAG: hypothetical protein AB7O50_14315 [Pseudolabrys sp.]
METNNQKLIATIAIFPICGGIVAVSYDVGYFSGLDISLFTFFDLSEHLTFAFEAIPFAFLLTLFVFTLIVALGYFATFKVALSGFYDWAFGSGREWAVAVKAGAFFSQFFRVPRRRKIAFILFFILAALAVPLSWKILDDIFEGRPILFVSLVIALVCSPYIFFSNRIFRVMALSWGVLVVATLLAFFVGLNASSQVLNGDSEHIIRLKNLDISGTVLRSGSRGILIVREDRKQLSFLRWDEIREIITVRPNRGWLRSILSPAKRVL